jgi:hypothetical protein
LSRRDAHNVTRHHLAESSVYQSLAPAIMSHPPLQHFGIAVDRKHTLKRLFLKKKPPFDELKKSMCIPKML